MSDTNQPVIEKTAEEKVAVLHLLTAAKYPSPFDINMAYDAGFDKIVPYTHVTLEEVTALTQDAIFSRSLSAMRRQSIFIGGRCIDLALSMQLAAKSCMFTPFEICTFSDPSGAFTTAAAMMAKVEAVLISRFGGGFKGRRVSVFGAGGPVSSCAAIIADQAGADVELVAHRALNALQVDVDTYNARFACHIRAVDGASDAAKIQLASEADVIICAAAAGIRVLNLAHFSQSTRLKVMADVNAVAPSGIEGIEPHANAELIAGTAVCGIGALAIGHIKYQTQQGLLKLMLATSKPIHVEFKAAFEFASNLLKNQ